LLYIIFYAINGVADQKSLLVYAINHLTSLILSLIIYFTMTYNFKEGEMLLLNKPYRWTSFDVVCKVRGRIWKSQGERLKVGHAGTLDPLASGLMIVCTGKLTKTLDSYQAQTKEYIAHVRLGAVTPSADLETEISQTFPYEHITRELFEAALKKFTGTFEQTPSAYSAKKINGQRAYKKAQKGKKVVMKPATVEVKEIETLDFNLPDVSLRIVCSKGTYIRSLADDLGKALNSGAHLAGLVRTKIGDYTLEQAMNVYDFLDQLPLPVEPNP